MRSSLASPVWPGMPVEYSVQTDRAGSGHLRYRYQVRHPDRDGFRLIRDFSPNPTLLWAALDEGIYEMQVVSLDPASGDSVTASTWVEVVSPGREHPLVQGTAHPLVFVFSAPACQDGGRMWVQFDTAGKAPRQTPAVPCDPERSRSFYLAGLRPNREYQAHFVVERDGTFRSGPTQSFFTREINLPAAPYDVLQTPPRSAGDDIIVQSPLSQLQIATDLWGEPVWYHASDIQTITRLEAGGTFWGLIQAPFGDATQQIVREFDLQGLTVRESNAERVNAQLAAMGARPITGFHHEARTLPDGNVVVLASVEQVLVDVQGEGPKSVIGDAILVLNGDLQVVWFWDAFAHLDVRRPALFDEVCTPASGGCPPFYLLPEANDWTHANSIQLTPDGDFLMSLRHLDWVIKIDYENGQGSGEVVWRLGRDGDFAIRSLDPSPWFSHQHDAQYLSGDDTRIVVFDNSNWRHRADPNAQSRVQVWKLNESSRIAELEVSVDIASYSLALGSVQRLPNGNFHA
ncbi:MAG: aryl-sulfate sulfotransferase, partial [Bryobacterales bacterium]|nr:aryl-sulfate sulfotransferase [Bryobacterales bacterium]